jgi:predicted ester cyclase
MPAIENEATGRQFFAEQDRLRGGPDPDLCAAGYTAQINGFPIMDLDGHHGMALGFYGAFPDLRHTIEDVVADDKQVAVRFRITGTHLGEFMGHPATTKPIDVVATVLLRVHNGKVTSLKGVFDLQGLLQQIGATPA